MTEQDRKKKCFVIGPIGKPNSPERNDADLLLEYIIKRALEDPEIGIIVQRAGSSGATRGINRQHIGIPLPGSRIV